MNMNMNQKKKENKLKSKKRFKQNGCDADYGCSYDKTSNMYSSTITDISIDDISYTMTQNQH